MILKREKDLEWAFFTLRNLKETINLFGATGTTMTNLSKGKFSSIKVIIPYFQLRIQFHYLIKPLFSKIKQLTLANIMLTKSRDLLLPRLISGKLDVENLDIAFPPGMQCSELIENRGLHADLS